MLSKAICQQCEHRVRAGRWNDTAEKEWEQGKVHCHHKPIKEARNLFDFYTVEVNEIPDWCPYSLEHLMETQNREKN